MNARAPISRLAAFGAVAGLAVLGPLVEGTLGGGRGWILGFLLMLIAPTLLRAGGARLHPLDPETFVPAMYFLSAGYAPLLHLISSKYLTLNTVETNAVRVAYMGAVGCALICTGFSMRPAEPASRPAPSARIIARDWGVIAMGSVGVALVGVWIVTTGVRTLFSSSYADTYLHEEGKGILVSGWYFIQLAIAYCAVRIVDFRRAGQRIPRLFIAAIAVLFSFLLINAVLGRRGPPVWALAAVVLSLHLSRVRIRRLWMVMSVGLLMIYGFAIEGYRNELGEGAEERIEAARAGLERVENPLVIQELEAVFANLAIVVDQKPPILHYPGESWINAFLVLIPKPIYPDRPTALAQRYVMWSSPSFAREGGGYAFNATGEGFLNLGLPGAVLQIFVFSAIFFFLPLAACIGKERPPLTRALAASLGAFAYNQFRGELASMLKVAVTFLLAAGLAHVLTAVIAQVQESLAAQDPLAGRPLTARRPPR